MKLGGEILEGQIQYGGTMKCYVEKKHMYEGDARGKEKGRCPIHDSGPINVRQSPKKEDKEE